MATNFASREGNCDKCNCQSDKQFIYRVEEKQRLCDKCAEMSDATVMDVDAPKKWKCVLHKTKLVELYCEPCKKCLCVTCVTTTHEGHRMVDIEGVVRQKQGALQQSLENIRDMKKSINRFHSRLSECAADTERMFKVVEDDITTAVDAESRQVEKEKNDKAERIRQEVEEEIRRIRERGDRQLRENDDDASNKRKHILERERALRDKLGRRRKHTKDRIRECKTRVEFGLASLTDAHEKTVAVISSDEREHVEKADSLSETVSRSLLGDFNTEIIDSITNGVRNVKFVGFPEKLRVGDVVVVEWKLTNIIPLRQFRGSSVTWLQYNGNNEVLVGMENWSPLSQRSVLNLDLNTRIEKRISGRGVTSCASLDDDTFVCGNSQKGCVSLYTKQWEHLKDIALPGTSTHRKIRPFCNVYVAVNKDGMILAARHSGSHIFVFNPVSGQHVRTISLGDKEVDKGLHVTPSGFIVVQTGLKDFTVVDESGVRKTITDVEWYIARCTVDTDYDLLYVMYDTKQDGVTRVDVMTFGLDGDVLMRTNIIEIRRNLFRSWSLAMCPDGQLAIVVDKKLLVYTNSSIK